MGTVSLGKSASALPLSPLPIAFGDVALTRYAGRFRSLDARPTELNVVVDLDAEAGRPSTGNRDDKHRVQIRQTTRVPLVALSAYLEGKAAFDTGVLEAISSSPS
jgi:hypothetical protein